MEDIGKIRKGLKIKLNQQVYLVTDFQFTKPGKGQAVYKCKLKNLMTGSSIENTWRSGDKFEKASLVTKGANFSYIEGDSYIFIDEDYEQLSVNKEAFDGKEAFLEDDMLCELVYFEDTLIEVTLPTFIEKKILYTEPGHKGDTTTNVLKPAKVDNDFEVFVPLFIDEGDIIRIDTRTGKYSARVTKG